MKRPVKYLSTFRISGVVEQITIEVNTSFLMNIQLKMIKSNTEYLKRNEELGLYIFLFNNLSKQVICFFLKEYQAGTN